MPVDVSKLTPAGLALFTTARALGARITSGYRTREENENVGGSPTSAHLEGNAIDIGADSPPLAVAVLGTIATGGFHDKGTAPHYHFEANPLTLIAFAGALIGIARLAGRAK